MKNKKPRKTERVANNKKEKQIKPFYAIVDFCLGYPMASKNGQMLVFMNKKSAEEYNEGMDEDIIKVKIIRFK